MPCRYLTNLLLPFLKIRESKAYIKQTKSVIDNVEKILFESSENKSLSNKVARPAYDLFLRETEYGDRIIERVHDLGQQSRFMYAAARLFQIYAALSIGAIILKMIFSRTHYTFHRWENLISRSYTSTTYMWLFSCIHLLFCG